MTVELVKSPFRYLFKPINYVKRRLECQIRAREGCVMVGGAIWNNLKVGGAKTKILNGGGGKLRQGVGALKKGEVEAPYELCWISWCQQNAEQFKKHYQQFKKVDKCSFQMMPNLSILCEKKKITKSFTFPSYCWMNRCWVERSWWMNCLTWLYRDCTWK